jgi:hypothetical protein
MSITLPGGFSPEKYIEKAEIKAGVSKKRVSMAVSFLSGLAIAANFDQLKLFISTIISNHQISDSNVSDNEIQEVKNVQASKVENNEIQESSPETDNAFGIKTIGLSDDMTFSEAFSISREELGSGGVFEWKGNLYNTYYKEEWDDLSDAAKNKFSEDIADLNKDISDPISTNDIDCEIIKNVHFIEEKFIASEYLELENGEDIKIDVFSRNGENYSKIDINNDGTDDYEFSVSNPTEFIGLNGLTDQFVDDISYLTEEELIISTEVIEIDGHLSVIKTFADNSQEVSADLDGDGTFESVLTFDEDGVIEDNLFTSIAPDDPHIDNLDLDEFDNYEPQ